MASHRQCFYCKQSFQSAIFNSHLKQCPQRQNRIQQPLPAHLSGGSNMMMNDMTKHSQQFMQIMMTDPEQQAILMNMNAMQRKQYIENEMEIYISRISKEQQQEYMQSVAYDDDEGMMEVKEWLSTTVNLPKYYKCFKHHEFWTLDKVKQIENKRELQEMGIILKGHQTKIMSEIKKLKEFDLQNQTDVAMEVKRWLTDQVCLEKYAECFKHHGFSSLNKVKQIENKKELQEIGIALKGHQTKLMSAINRLKQSRLTKMLLLGPTLSGKTSIFNIIQHKYQKDAFWGNVGYTNDDAKMILNDIRQKCVESALVLFEMAEMANCYDSNYNKLKNKLSINNQSDLNKIANIISNLWQNPLIKKIYSFRNLNEYKKNNRFLMNNMEYFFNDIYKYFNYQCEWLQNEGNKNKRGGVAIDDILKLNSIKKQSIQLVFYRDDHNRNCTLIDAPYGVMNKNEDFINNHALFDDIDGIIFTVPLSGFCEFNFKENNNALKHCMEYFNYITNIDKFKSIPVFIAYTKMDIFTKYIKNGYSLSHCFNSKLAEQFGDFCKIWDTNNDYGNIKILSHVTPHFIRKISVEYNLIVSVDIIQLIQTFISVSLHDDNDDDDDDMKYREIAYNFIVSTFHSLADYDGKDKNRVVFSAIEGGKDATSCSEVIHRINHIRTLLLD